MRILILTFTDNDPNTSDQFKR